MRPNLQILVLHLEELKIELSFRTEVLSNFLNQEKNWEL